MAYPAVGHGPAGVWDSRGCNLIAGHDLVAEAVSAEVAEVLALHLDVHVAARALGVGLAICAKGLAASAWYIDPTWLMSDDASVPWATRVERAAATVGAPVAVTGDLTEWTMSGEYRSMPFQANSVGHVDVFGGNLGDKLWTAAGPLAVLRNVISVVDELPRPALLHVASGRPL
ncbi:MAG: hypothetical protein R2705_15245 [Ilumatobacteraceae bacterium]